MNENTGVLLSETAANLVENIAYRVAGLHGGKITVNHLAPYLPMSLDLIRSCLDNMLDGHSVRSDKSDGFPIYEFAACPDNGSEKGVLAVDACVSCSSDFGKTEIHPVCRNCLQDIETELNRLAESTGWPAKAVYEHEILHLAAKRSGPHHAAELAGQSRFTLKRMQQKLKAMTLESFLRQEIDEVAATVVYHFPDIIYPKEMFQRNIAVIRRYPASVMEDVQIKATRIILVLASLLLGVFFLALLRVPLPVLIVGYLVVAPIVAIKIWLKKDQPPEV